VKETLLEAAALVALPILIVVVTQIDDVFARNVGWPTRWGEHLALHTGLDFARDLHQKFFPLAARPCVFVGFLENVVGGLAVDPTSDRIN
jgi:hypothetical protein